MSNTKFYIDTVGNDDNAYFEAMKRASDIVEADSQIKRVVLLVNKKTNTGWFKRLLGPPNVKKLWTGLKISGFAPLYKLETKITYKDSYSATDVVITCG